MAPSEQVINLGGPMATRRASLLSGTAGIVAGLLLWRLTSAVIPIGAEATSMALRLGLAAAAMLPCVAILAAMILAQMGARFMLGAFDPTDGDEARFLRTNQRVISNSVEQLRTGPVGAGGRRTARGHAGRAGAGRGVRVRAVGFLGRLSRSAAGPGARHGRHNRRQPRDIACRGLVLVALNRLPLGRSGHVVDDTDR
jgi:hypothetical protein